MIAGATAVQVGTATFWDPRSPVRIARELAKFPGREKITSVRDLVDTLKLQGSKAAAGLTPRAALP